MRAFAALWLCLVLVACYAPKALAADCLYPTSETTFAVASGQTFPDCAADSFTVITSPDYADISATAELWGMPTVAELRNVFAPIFLFILIIYLSAYGFGVVVSFASRV